MTTACGFLRLYCPLHEMVFVYSGDRAQRYRGSGNHYLHKNRRPLYEGMYHVFLLFFGHFCAGSVVLILDWDSVLIFQRSSA